VQERVEYDGGLRIARKLTVACSRLVGVLSCRHGRQHACCRVVEVPPSPCACLHSRARLVEASFTTGVAMVGHRHRAIAPLSRRSCRHAHRRIVEVQRIVLEGAQERGESDGIGLVVDEVPAGQQH